LPAGWHLPSRIEDIAEPLHRDPGLLKILPQLREPQDRRRDALRHQSAETYIWVRPWNIDNFCYAKYLDGEAGLSSGAVPHLDGRAGRAEAVGPLPRSGAVIAII